MGDDDWKGRYATEWRALKVFERQRIRYVVGAGETFASTKLRPELVPLASAYARRQLTILDRTEIVLEVLLLVSLLVLVAVKRDAGEIWDAIWNGRWWLPIGGLGYWLAASELRKGARTFLERHERA